MRQRAKLMRKNARDVVELMALRAEEYVGDPSEARFHAMDPANM